jgi:hypothetical protein
MHPFLLMITCKKVKDMGWLYFDVYKSRTCVAMKRKIG